MALTDIPIDSDTSISVSIGSFEQLHSEHNLGAIPQTCGESCCMYHTVLTVTTQWQLPKRNPIQDCGDPFGKCLLFCLGSKGQREL